jgi:hypothetical protein
MRAVKMAFWVVYDHLGLLILANVSCVAVLLPPAAILWAALFSGDPVLHWMVGVPASAAILAVALPISVVAIACISKSFLASEEAGYRCFMRGAREFSLPAVALGMMATMTACVLLISVWFYAERGRAGWGWIGYGLSATALWALAAMGLATAWALPALVHKKTGVWAAWKLGLLLTLGNPVYSVSVVVLATLFWAATLVVLPLAVFFSISPVVAFFCCAYEVLARKYAAVESVGLSQWRAKMAEQDKDDFYLNRGFRDFLFPWKQG